MLVELAIGDAYGRAFEFNTPEFVRNNNYLKYHARKDEKDTDNVGIYTDDTQMSIAIAEHMKESIRHSSYYKASELHDLMRQGMTHLEYAEKFSNAYNRDVRDGYSKRTKALIKRKIARNLVAASAKQEPRNSNGSVMRAVPLGLYPTASLVKQAVIINTTLTHTSLECIEATMFIALISHYMYHNYTKADKLTEFLAKEMGTETVQKIITAYTGGPIPCDAILTASFCYQALAAHKKMDALLLACIEPTGDVDSVASICLGIASIDGMTNNLPAFMYDQLESGAYGHKYLKSLDKELFERYPKQ